MSEMIGMPDTCIVCGKIHLAGECHERMTALTDEKLDQIRIHYRVKIVKKQDEILELERKLKLIAEMEKDAMENLTSSANRWESACASAMQIAPGSDGVLMVDGYVAGLRSAEEYARELEFLLQAALDCKPSDLGDWKREVRRKFPRLAAR